MFIGRRNEIVMLSDEVNVLLVAVFVGLCFHRLRPHRAAGPSLNPAGICFHTLSLTWPFGQQPVQCGAADFQDLRSHDFIPTDLLENSAGVKSLDFLIQTIGYGSSGRPPGAPFTTSSGKS